MQKKGAIEFSMTTIMVVIIGVAVLALGLAWVRGTFKQIDELTKSSLENAETILGEVAFTGKISAPATITMDKKDAKKFRVLVRNTQASEDTFTLAIPDATLTCVSTQVPAGPVEVEANEVGELTGGLIADCSSSGNGIVTIKIIGTAAGNYATEAIAVQVK